jgi:hypothetical protein
MISRMTDREGRDGEGGEEEGWNWERILSKKGLCPVSGEGGRDKEEKDAMPIPMRSTGSQFGGRVSVE